MGSSAPERVWLDTTSLRKRAPHPVNAGAAITHRPISSCATAAAEGWSVADLVLGSRAGLSSVQSMSGVAPLPTDRRTLRQGRRDSPETDRHAAMQRNVGRGQERHKPDADDQTECAFRANRLIVVASKITAVHHERGGIRRLATAFGPIASDGTRTAEREF